ncbi:MAG: HAD family hydrolase [Treponemataceae bacterium]|nr:HAD family hydrolase [Treponemataceae bacterium]
MEKKPMIDQIEAIAFDIDGTLYSSALFYLRIAPYFFRHIAFFANYNKVRKILHRTAPLADFYGYQARLLEDFMKESKGKSRQMIQDIVYDGMKPYFAKTKPYRDVDEFFEWCKSLGLKIGILSDFPPEQKGDIFNLAPYCDVIMGSEAHGALKPSIYTFGQLAMKLGVPNDKILYVGNSVRADINGAKAAGMKTAYIQTGFARLFNKRPANADISFKSYRKLRDLMLK